MREEKVTYLQMSKVVRDARIIAGKWDYLYDDEGKLIKIKEKKLIELMTKKK